MDRISPLQHIMQESTSRPRNRPQISPSGPVLSSESTTNRLGSESISRPSPSQTQRPPPTNPFLQSWSFPTTMKISHVLQDIQSVPPTFKINSLKWYKNRAGVKHEFLVLEVERSERNNLWLRIDRRADDDTTSAQILVSKAEPVDTIRMCDYANLLANPNAPSDNIDCKLATVFKCPPPLPKLGVLLSIISQESPHYLVHADNCYFYCATIHENLVELAEGEYVDHGAPDLFSMLFGRPARSKIKMCMRASNLTFPPLTNSQPRSTTPLPNQSPGTAWSNGAGPSTWSSAAAHNVARTSESSNNIPMIEPISHVSSDAHLRTTHLHSSTPYLRRPLWPPFFSFRYFRKPSELLHNRPPSLSPAYASSLAPTHSAIPTSSSGRRQQQNEAPIMRGLPSISPTNQPPNPVTPQLSAEYTGNDRPIMVPRAEPTVPNLLPGREKMCIAVDFGTVLSGVACGVSSNLVKQIMWPGSHRKVPSCLVYNQAGGVVAWGQEALSIKLHRGWARCEMFKLHLDSASATGLGDPFHTVPVGKEPMDLLVDYLHYLWEHAKPRILENSFTEEDLKSADIWLSIPTTWRVQSGEIMREAAFRAGLVGQRGSRDRLHIISESEAAGVHCALWNNFPVQPGGSFMVCDAGGGTIDTAVFRMGIDAQVSHRSCTFGGRCGSQFLDVQFRLYLEQWHQARNILLSETNLAHYMDRFTNSVKILFTGEVDAEEFLFDCYDISDYPLIDIPGEGFLNGQLVVTTGILRNLVFDPIVERVLAVLEHQLKEVDPVDALLLVGGFSGNEYLFNRIKDRFQGRINEANILSPRDPDIATSLGAAKLGLTQSLIHRPSWAPMIVASKSYIIGVGPNLAAGSRGARSTAGTRVPHQVYEAQYMVVKGALLKKGVAVLEEFHKFSIHSSDFEFVVRLYTSDSAEIVNNTSQGDLTHLRDWKIDLSVVRSFMRHAQNPPLGGFHTKFEVGIEVDSREVWAVWVHDGIEGGRTKLHAITS